MRVTFRKKLQSRFQGQSVLRPKGSENYILEEHFPTKVSVVWEYINLTDVTHDSSLNLILWLVVLMLVVFLRFKFQIHLLSLFTGIFLLAGIWIVSVSGCLHVGKYYTQFSKAEGCNMKYSACASRVSK